MWRHPVEFRCLPLVASGLQSSAKAGNRASHFDRMRAASGGTEQELARVGGNAYVDRNVQSGATYAYRVQAISGTLVGPISASASVTIP